MRVGIKTENINSYVRYTDVDGRESMYIHRLLGNLGERSDYPGNQRIASMLTFKNTIIAEGNNQFKTHPLQKRYATNPEALWLHAEIDTISKALKTLDTHQFRNTTLYVARLKKDGTVGKARPCHGCANLIKQMRIGRIVWTEEQ